MATGPHLHFVIRVWSRPVDPLDYCRRYRRRHKGLAILVAGGLSIFGAVLGYGLKEM